MPIYFAICCYVYISALIVYDVNQSHSISNATIQTRKIRVSQGVEKYNKAKIERFGANSTDDSALANGKLHTLDAVGVADRSLDKLFWPPFFLYAR
jgi:hypothetical protein